MVKRGDDVENILEVKQVEKYYGRGHQVVKAIDDMSFSMEKGEFTAIMGPSGSGKTTLLNVISTIDSVSGGKVLINNRDITEMNAKELADFRRQELGFIFQEYNLLDTLTLKENIALALSINKVKPKEIDRRVQEYATKLGIEKLLHKYIYELSGGEQQRGACARALVTHPSLILADEPTGSLDSRSAQMLIETMSSMNKDMEATILMVTHDSFTASYCKKVIFIKDGSLFTELHRGQQSRKQFFNQILDVVALLGGDVKDVR